MSDRSDRDRLYKAKRAIAGALAAWLATIIVAGASLLIANRLWSPEALADRSGWELLRDIGLVILPPAAALFASIVGFYYAHEGHDRKSTGSE
ncbi:MAG: hypothetical protein AB7H71_03540 [Alphaproteobacteria bacterium]